MTHLRKLVHIFIVENEGRQGRIAAPNVDLDLAPVIAEALEANGHHVVMDPPRFGLIQNTISWRDADLGYVRAAPWREYLVVRARVERMEEAFDTFYERGELSSDKSFWQTWKTPA